MSRPHAPPILPDARTARLELRRWSAADAAGLAAVNDDAEVVRFVNDGVPLTSAESHHTSAQIAAHWADYGFGLWATRRRGERDLLGFIGVCHPLWFPACAHLVEVGWRLRRDAWGRGYATEGARTALDAAFEALTVDRIVAFIHPGNQRSHAVAARLGMERDGRLPHPTRPFDIDVYTIERPECDRRPVRRG